MVVEAEGGERTEVSRGCLRAGGVDLSAVPSTEATGEGDTAHRVQTDPRCLGAVINFCRTGTLHMPKVNGQEGLGILQQ